MPSALNLSGGGRMATIEFKGRMVQYDETIIGKWSFQRKIAQASGRDFVFIAADALFEDADAVAELFDDDAESMGELVLEICKNLNENAKN